MSNSAQGVVLTGQAVGVTQGTGVTISSAGVISFDASTASGIMRLNNPGAYNAYVWPGVDGAAGQQLTTDGAGNLVWTASGTPTYTAKGQIEVATGAGTSALLNVGTNTSFLIADSTTATGLIYSGSSTSAAQMPAGLTGARPNPATAGQIRYNTTTQKFEFATGATSWEQIASGDPAVSTFVIQTVPSAGTASAVIPGGTTAQQQTAPAPVAGYIRYNSDLKTLEVFDGATWGASITSSNLGLGVSTNGIYTVTKVTEAAVPPTPGTGQTQAILGSTYYDVNLGQMFTYYSNGGSPVWASV
jgi:hypothetical protein